MEEGWWQMNQTGEDEDDGEEDVWLVWVLLGWAAAASWRRAGILWERRGGQ